MSRRRALAVLAAALLVGGTSACGTGTDDEPTLVVYAAASLAPTFERLGAAFEQTHDGVRVELSVGGSSDLVAQLQHGAPADVLATADETTMSVAVDDGLTGSAPEVFATNTLRLVVPPDNPGGVTGVADLADPDVDLVVCAPAVPCGAAARTLAERVGVRLSPVSEEQSVTDVLGKVRSGEADAGLVYVTDAVAAGDDVRVIEVPGAEDVVNGYPVAALADSDQPDLADEFVELVLSAEGQRILADAGFGRP